jgi:uridylate kinase
MRVVVSVGGSVLAPDLDPERVRTYAAAIGDLLAEGHEVGAVVGGGTVAREYIDAARALGANEIELDELGIGVTRLNARLLVAALGRETAPSPAETYEEAGEAMRHGDVAVMGGIVAGQTTDAVSAALAEYVGADLLVYATSVSGVYSADPGADPDAERFAELTPSELVDIVADIEMRAGSSAPVDLLAAKLVQRSGVRTVVIDGTDPETVVDAVLEGRIEGTEIRPEP